MKKGYTLKLSAYVLAISKIGEKNQTVKFCDALSEMTGETEKNKMFDHFISDFENTFKSKFILNYEGTKAIAIKSLNCISNRNIIDGMLVGGLTGIEQDVYKTNSSINSDKSISNDEVAALPYYFKLWMPFDSSVGVLMVQSYTEAGVVSLIKDKIVSFFRQNKYLLIDSKYVPNNYKENFKKRSTINKLILTKTQMSSMARGALNSIFASFEGLKVEIRVSGFDINVDKFWKEIDKNKPLNADLSYFEMKEAGDDYNVIATYKDENGRQAQACLTKEFDILPNIILSDEIKEDGKQYPNYERIQNHTNDILEEIKKEIGYAPNDVE